MISVFTLLLILGVPGARSQAEPTGHPDAQAHLGKGYEFEKDDRFADAAEEFAAALALNARLSGARYQLAVCYFALGRHDDARREFGHLLLETHDDPSVIYFSAALTSSSTMQTPPFASSTGWSPSLRFPIRPTTWALLISKKGTSKMLRNGSSAPAL